MSCIKTYCVISPNPFLNYHWQIDWFGHSQPALLCLLQHWGKSQKIPNTKPRNQTHTLPNPPHNTKYNPQWLNTDFQLQTTRLSVLRELKDASTYKTCCDIHVKFSDTICNLHILNNDGFDPDSQRIHMISNPSTVPLVIFRPQFTWIFRLLMYILLW